MDKEEGARGDREHPALSNYFKHWVKASKIHNKTVCLEPPCTTLCISTV